MLLCYCRNSISSIALNQELAPDPVYPFIFASNNKYRMVELLLELAAVLVVAINFIVVQFIFQLCALDTHIRSLIPESNTFFTLAYNRRDSIVLLVSYLHHASPY